MVGYSSLSLSLRAFPPITDSALPASPHSQHDNYMFESYARDLVQGLPPNAVLFTNDDVNCATTHYVMRCEQVCGGVHVWHACMAHALMAHAHVARACKLRLPPLAPLPCAHPDLTSTSTHTPPLSNSPQLRPDVQFIRLPLITYPWWKPMQLHHYCTSPTECVRNTTTPYGEQLSNFVEQQTNELSERWAALSGAIASDGGNATHTADGQKKDGEKKSKKKKKKKKKKKEKEAPRSNVIDLLKYNKHDLIFPGQRHHPHEIHDGSFAMASMVEGNLR